MKTTPTLGLKLYDGTDAPDLVSGYNASMATLDRSRILCFKRPLAGTDDLNDIHDTGYYNDASSVIPANAAPGLARPVRYIVLDACTSPGRGQCTTQIAVGDPVAGKDNVLVRSYGVDTGWTEWLPVSAEQGALPANGAAGQVLVKSSASSYDCEWMDPSALTNVLSLDSTYGLQQGDTLAPALQVRSSTESMVAMQASTQTVQCQRERNVYGALTAAGVTMRNAGGNTYYIIDGDGKGVLGNVGILNNGAPVTQSTGLIAVSPSNTGGSDYSKFVGSALKAGKDYLGILETQGIVNGYTVFAYGCVVISMTAAAVTVVGTPVYNLIGKAVAVPMQIVCEYGGGTTVLLSEGSTEQFSTINITPIGNI